MRQILQLADIATKCILEEGLYWIAFQEYPIAEPTENELDAREDPDYDENYGLNRYYSKEAIFTPEFCKKYGLPNNPTIEYRIESFGGEPYFASGFSPEHLDKLEAGGHFSKSEIDEMRQGETKQKDFDLKQKVFDDALESFLEVPQSELFLALRKGEVKAYGRFLPSEEDQEKEGYELPKYELIPHMAWSARKVSWVNDKLQVVDRLYTNILLDVESLFSAFPEPEPEIVKISKINGTYIIEHKEGRPVIRGKIGRPSFNWKQFQVEMLRRFASKSLPKLQKVCVAEMREWCQQNWGKTPSDTNLKDHISAYYEVGKSEKKNNALK